MGFRKRWRPGHGPGCSGRVENGVSGSSHVKLTMVNAHMKLHLMRTDVNGTLAFCAFAARRSDAGADASVVP
jgi:hypothetical protein